MVTRRNFIRTSLMTSAAAVLACQSAKTPTNKLDSFGFQAWTIREKLNTDPAATCKLMAEYGYKEIEMCSPLGYKDAGFAPLHEYSGTELRTIIEDNGLICTSSHFNLGELRDSLDDRIEWAHQMGMKQMVLSSFWLPQDTATIDDYRKSADELNKIAKKTKAAGLQMGFHNHHMEFQKRGDNLIYEALLDEFDPELVKMQFQVAVVNIGYKAAEYFRKYPGRFISAHLQDWSQESDKYVPVGQGDIDWNDFLAAAKVGGVKNIYVEQDPTFFQKSGEYLKTL